MTGKADSRVDATTLAREYYQALDTHDYETLESLLAAEFVHQRPDMTLEGGQRFVQFMRSERPNTETSHVIDGVYERTAGGVGETNTNGVYERTDDGRETAADGFQEATIDEKDATKAVAVSGRLLDEHDERITGFVDIFTVADGRIQRIRTYTD